MRKANKTFDCVQMKWDIQQRIQAEYRDMSAEETRAAQRRAIESDPILGPYLKKVKSARRTPTAQ